MSKVGGDLSEYVANNDEPLTADNYNEVDGLTLSELSYLRFEDLDWSDPEYQDGITVGEFAERMVENQMYDNDDQRVFLENLAESDRYSNLEITDMAALNGRDYWSNGDTSKQFDDGQWAGLTVKLDDDTSAVAFRGTNGTKLGWDEDLEFAYDRDGNAAQKAARDYLQNQDADNLYVAGHSKGGADAESAAVMADEATRQKIVRVDNYDGPSNNNEFKAKYADGYADLDGKQHNHYPEDSVIGQLNGEHPGDEDFCHTDTSGHKMDNIMGEHDPFAWKIKGDGFDETEQSEFSKYLDKVLEDTLKTYPNGGKEEVVFILKHLGPTVFLDTTKSTPEKLIRFLLGLETQLPREKRALKSFLRRLLFFAEIEGIKYGWNKLTSKAQGSMLSCSNKFSVNTQRLKTSVNTMEKAENSLDAKSRAVLDVMNNLQGKQFEEVRMALDTTSKNLMKNKKQVLTLYDGLNEIIREYDQTETDIRGFVKSA